MSTLPGAPKTDDGKYIPVSGVATRKRKLDGTPLTTLESAAMAQKSLEEARHHIGPSGELGIVRWKFSGYNGRPLSEEERMAAVYEVNGRRYYPDEFGDYTEVDTECFIPELRKRVELEKYVAQFACIVLGSNSMAERLFGKKFIEKCKPQSTDFKYHGHTVPSEIMKVNCEPEYISLWESGCYQWNVGMAKLRALIKIFMPITRNGDFTWDRIKGGAHDTETTDTNKDKVDRDLNKARGELGLPKPSDVNRD